MSTNAQRLGQAVLARRRELELTQLEVWQAEGPSNTTLTQIENGLSKSLPRKTARKLDHALKWEPGSARRVWEGGDPIPLGGRGDFEAEVLGSDLAESTKQFILENIAMATPTPPAPHDSATG